MREVVVASAARTAIGSFGGAFKDVSAKDLGVAAAKEAMNRAKITPEMVDEIKQGLIAQGGGIVKNPVTRVFVSPDGRYNAPGVEV